MSNLNRPITSSTFNASLLSVGEPKKLEYSSTVYMNYDGNKRVRIQAPRMTIPFDLKDYDGNKKFKVQFNLKGHESNPKMKAYFDMLQEIDEFVISQAVANADKWLGKKGKSREVIEEGYTRSVKFPKDASKDYPPTQAVAVKHDGKLVNGVQQLGTFQVELYDAEDQLIEESPLTHLKRGTQVTPILEAAGIWIAGKGNFGITWKLHQARVDVPGTGAVSRGFMGGAEESVTVDAETDLLTAVVPTTTEDGEEGDDAEGDDEEVEQARLAAEAAAAAAAAAAAKKTTATKAKTAARK